MKKSSARFANRVFTKWIVIIVVLSLTGCGGDNPVGPTVEINGTWLFEESGGVTTEFGSQFSEAQVLLHLTQTGSSISGQHTDGQLEIVNSIAGRFHFQIPEGAITGSLKGNKITLTFNTDAEDDENDLETFTGIVEEEDKMEDDNPTSASAWSAQFLTLLLPPSNLNAEPSSSSSVVLTWEDNSDNELGFIVEGRTAGREFVEIGTVDIDATGVQIIELLPSTLYFFRVRAFNEKAKSAYTNRELVSTPSEQNDSALLRKNYFGNTISWLKAK